MLPKQKPIRINLLQDDAFSNSVVGKFLIWALSIGRYVVVFTELIVILSFLSRFKLDRDLTDLNEDIEQQKGTILSYGTLETDLLAIQEKLAFVREKTSLPPAEDSLTLMSKTLPADLRIKQLQVKGENHIISGYALRTDSLAQFVAGLMRTGKFASVSVDKITADAKLGALEFTIKLEAVKSSPIAKKPIEAANTEAVTTNSELEEGVNDGN